VSTPNKYSPGAICNRCGRTYDAHFPSPNGRMWCSNGSHTEEFVPVDEITRVPMPIIPCCPFCSKEVTGIEVGSFPAGALMYIVILCPNEGCHKILFSMLAPQVAAQEQSRIARPS